MPVQCTVCLDPDTDNDWSVLACGHCFHTLCLQQSLEYNKRCPKCRTAVDTRRGQAGYRRIFLDYVDEAGASQRGAGSGGGERDCAVELSVGQLQMQLLVKDQKLQQLQVQLEEGSKAQKKLEEELQLTQKSLRKKEEKLQRTIGELAQLSRQNKLALNDVANLKVELRNAQTVSTRAAIAMDATLVGEPLARELRKLMEQDIEVPAYFQMQLEASARNKQYNALSNKILQKEREMQQAEGQLKHEIHRLQQQVKKLQQQLESQQQQQQAAAMAAPSHRQAAAGSGVLPGGGRGLGFGDPLLFEGSDALDYVPAPRNSGHGAASKPGLRQRMQLRGMASARAPVQPGPPAAALPSGAHTAAAGPSRAAPGPSQLQQPQGGRGQAAAGQQQAGEPEEGDFVLLDSSEEQELEPAGNAAPAGAGAGWGQPGAAAAADGAAEDEAEDSGWYSEVESDEEQGLAGGSSGRQQQQQQQDQQHLRAAEAAQPSGSAQLGLLAAQQLLGKRRSPEVQQPLGAAPRQQQQQQHSPAAATRQGGAGNAGARVLQSSNRAGYNPLPLKAGPLPSGLGRAPGPSFLRDPTKATNGLDGQSKYIHRGPDGKGGLVSVFKAGPEAEARPRALQQAQLKPHAAAGGGTKRQKAGGGAKLPGSSGLRIEHFFDRAT